MAADRNWRWRVRVFRVTGIGTHGIIEDPELACAFLSEGWPFENEVMRPIDKLKSGKVEEVMDAAPSFGTAIT